MVEFLFVLALVVFLTFMLTSISWVARALEPLHPKLKGKSQNSSLIWLTAILIAGVLNPERFGLTIPRSSIAIEPMEALAILGGVTLFAIHSEYPIHKTWKPFLIFTFVFPLGEEILFRGIIQSIIVNTFSWGEQIVSIPFFGNVPIAVGISALCFGITHFQYNAFRFNSRTVKQVLFATLFGLFAGKIVLETGSIVYPLILHGLANVSSQLYGLRRREVFHAE